MIGGRRLDRAASLTAQINAAQRAAETLQPSHRRLIDDPYSGWFVTHPVLKLLLVHRLSAACALWVLDRLYGGLHAHIVLRVRYADEQVRWARGAGIDQLVLLGAGFDTTSQRATGDTMTVFEVDMPTTQAAKRAIFDRRSPIGASQGVVWVACDFEHDDLKTCLHSAGFDPAKPALVLWLGVTFYLTGTAFDTCLAALGTLCAPGSRLVFDYGDPGIVDGTTGWASARRVARLVARRGEPYRTGLTAAQLDQRLQRHGFWPATHYRVPDLLARYAPSARRDISSDDWLAIVCVDRS